MENFEKLGVFYLGRPYDLDAKAPKEGLLLYDAKDLVTHAVCVGMTGSGKTGLCISLLEEAAIDGIPAIIVDPKGDLPNLLLTFPELRPEDFAPWVNEDDARRKGLSVEEYAAQQADLWRKGLAEWGEDGDRIRRLRDAADFRIYTPGSTAGIPVSILSSFAPPPEDVRGDSELMRERVGTTVTSLLGLLGIDADPIKSREHILLSTIVGHAWADGQAVDLGSLITSIQQPSFTKIGVMELESFFPSKDRFELAMSLNNLLAAPGFENWLEGEPLDVGKILYTETGKPRMAIFSVAHLGDAERMFFVSLLLNQVLGWMRGQPGTTSLRAILYIDEIFGYFPPVANPPSKLPLMTILKQGRAFGLGAVLVTQNPVDLDYKGLSNAGTWFIGRLQTERDKAKVMEGLEGAASSAGAPFDRGRMEQVLAALGNRVFLLNDVHEDAPEIFESRWAMSYLRGPITRAQIKTLMEGARTETPAPALAASSTFAQATASAAPVARSQRPVLPPEIMQFFVPVRGARPNGATLAYVPTLVGVGSARCADSKRGVDVCVDVTAQTPIVDAAVPVDWDQARVVELVVDDLEREPEEGATFASLPTAAAKAKSYAAWSKDFGAWLYRTQSVGVFRSPSTGEISRPGEDERDFRIRLQQAARERRDAEVEKLRQKYAPKHEALEERIRRAEQALAREAEQAKSSKLDVAVSIGASILGSFFGRKSVTSAALGKAGSAVRGVGRTMKEGQDVDRAQENLDAVKQQLAELDEQFMADSAAIASAIDPASESFETIRVKPTKANVSVRLVALAWAPTWVDGSGASTPAGE